MRRIVWLRSLVCRKELAVASSGRREHRAVPAHAAEVVVVQSGAAFEDGIVILPRIVLVRAAQ